MALLAVGEQSSRIARKTPSEGMPSDSPYCFVYQSLPTFWWGRLFSVDLSRLWRRHIVWAKENGDDLVRVVTARYTTTTVLLSLLVSAEIAVLFSPSPICEDVRQSLKLSNGPTTNILEFTAGFVLCLSIFTSLSGVIANFAAWSIFVVLAPENASSILRSDIGLYAAHLPSRLVVVSVYLFVLWVCLFWWILMPLSVAGAMSLCGVIMITHIATTYSRVGQVIMATNAMSSRERIFAKDKEEKMTPRQLGMALLAETKRSIQAGIPVQKQYRLNHSQRVPPQEEV